MTPHIEAEIGDIAKYVLMPGDPNRATYIANKYLEEASLVNKVRGELAYTGKYKGVEVTVFSSGMGIGSMGIYSHELFDVYDVNAIIRIGTAGAYKEELKPYTIIIADSSYSDTNFDLESGSEDIEIINSSFELNNIINMTANIRRIDVITGRVYTTDAFYTDRRNYDYFINKGCIATEMETYALLYNAKKFHKMASSILTISDNLITHEEMSSEERERRLDDMIVLALDSIIKLEK